MERYEQIGNGLSNDTKMIQKSSFPPQLGVKNVKNANNLKVQIFSRCDAIDIILYSFRFFIPHSHVLAVRVCVCNSVN